MPRLLFEKTGTAGPFNIFLPLFFFTPAKSRRTRKGATAFYLSNSLFIKNYIYGHNLQVPQTSVNMIPVRGFIYLYPTEAV